MKKTLKKITCAALAAVSVFGCAATLTACETSHPEVEMKIEFDDKTYTLEYELYRNIAPATVKHFLFLAGNGYYDGLVVHDYSTSSRLYTGVYSSGEEAGSLVYKKYFETIAGYDNYKSFPHSVWMDEEKSSPLYTLKGEFEDNNFTVTNGDLKETFGSLTMYYHDISSYSTVADSNVYVARASEEGKVNKGDYKFNSTTSMFYISLTTTTKSNNGYCTFAKLDKDSVDTLKNLQEAIADYVDAHYSENEDEFTHSTTMKVFEDDKMFEHYSVTKTYSVPMEPITLKSVKVKKY